MARFSIRRKPVRQNQTHQSSSRTDLDEDSVYQPVQIDRDDLGIDSPFADQHIEENRANNSYRAINQSDSHETEQTGTMTHSPYQEDEIVDSSPRTPESDEKAAGIATGFGMAEKSAAEVTILEDVLIGEPRWLPYTLRWQFLTSLMIFSLGLSVMVATLTWHSVKNSGLGHDDGSSGLLFGWRFTPTIVAVIYVLMTNMVLSDVQRTEPFARLSRNADNSAEDTLLNESGGPWVPLLNWIKRKKRQDHFRSTVLAAAVLNIIGFVAISPLSSAFLTSQSVVLKNTETFNQPDIFNTSSPLLIQADDLTYLRTFANILQSVETSPWLLENYTVMPIWPSTLTSMPTTQTLSTSSETWKGNTTVFQAKQECVELEFTGNGSTIVYDPNSEYEGGPAPESRGYVLLNSTDGCGYQVFAGVIGMYGGSIWGSPNQFPKTIPGPATSSGEGFISNGKCQGRELMIMTTAWATNSIDYTIGIPFPWRSDIKLAAHLCSPKYFMGNVSVTVSTTYAGSTVTIDDDEFDKAKVPVTSSVLNINRIQNVFLNQNWTDKLYEINTTNIQGQGPMVLLDATYNYDIQTMISDGDLLTRALRLKQRFLGEILMSAFQSRQLQKSSTLTGSIEHTSDRVLIIPYIGAVLSGLLFLSVLLLAVVFYTSRLHRRKLNLFSDPATAMATTALTLDEPRLKNIFRGAEGLSNNEMLARLEAAKYGMKPGSLIVTSQSLSPGNENDMDDELQHRGTVDVAGIPSTQDWRPFALRYRSGLGFMFVLLAILVTMAVLYYKSRSHSLYQSAFVYQHDVSLFDGFSTSITPYSIVPTFVASMVSIWWGEIDGVFRRLQPYASMAESPVRSSNSADLSYTGSYLLVAAWKALRRRHGTLVLICTGALLTEIFTVSMSAVWQIEDSYLTRNVTLQRSLQLRSSPYLYQDSISTSNEGSGTSSEGLILDALYNDPTINWLYTATNQLIYNKSEPSWSSEGWSFVPIDLSPTYDVKPSVQNASSENSPASNVTVTTPGLKARLQCSPIDTTSNVSDWLTLVDLTNSTIFNVSSNPKTLKSGYMLNPLGFQVSPIGASPTYRTSFFEISKTPACCSNVTDGKPGRAALGYWSYNFGNGSYDFAWGSGTTFPQNITIKWLVGYPEADMYDYNADKSWEFNFWYGTNSTMIWAEPPKLVALSCVPAVDGANASVTVDRDTQSVQSYQLLDEPKDFVAAWTDDFNSQPNSQVSDLKENYTTSFGSLFQESLLHSADLSDLNPCYGSCGVESLTERTFKIHLPGLNFDFPSYAMYVLAGSDPEALLDPVQLESYAQTTFATFFQHFAALNVTLSDGGWVFQPIDQSTLSTRDNDQATTLQAAVRLRISSLRMAPTATALCLGIICFLFLTLTYILPFANRHFQNIRGDVNTIAGILRLTYDSPKLLQWLRERRKKTMDTNGHSSSESDPNIKSQVMVPDDPLVYLGGFVDNSGTERWGVEIVDDNVDK